jgi:hypothetical protein
MDARQSLALSNPLARADDDPRMMLRFLKRRTHSTGLLLQTILAVDR